MARAASSPGVTRSAISRAVLARSFSAIQPSMEKRSRTLPALTMARVEHADQRRRDAFAGSMPRRVEVVGEVGDQRRVGVGGLGEADVVGAHQAHARPRRARRSGRARRGCRRRGSAGRRGGRGRRAWPSVGSMVTVSTGRRLTTQTSAAVPPRCMAMALASGALPMRAKPPRMTSQPCGVRARKTRRLIGRGTSTPFCVGRGGRERDRLLADELGAVGLEPGVEGAARLVAEPAAEDGGVVGLVGQAGGERRADHHPVLVGADVVALGRLAAPPGGDVGQDQRLAEQRLGDARQEGEERAGLEDAGAERVDQGDASPGAARRRGRGCRGARRRRARAGRRRRRRGGARARRPGGGRRRCAP